MKEAKPEHQEPEEKEPETIILGASQAGRLDSVLAAELADFSRNHIQKLIEQGLVFVNDIAQQQKKFSVSAGDRIRLSLPRQELPNVLPQNIPLDTVYEDADVLVINKPRGMVVHPAPGNPDGTLVNAVLFHCSGRLSSINGVIRPGIVHRIDKDTSGLLVLAKNDRAHQALSGQLAAHEMHRRYLAIVRHNFTEDRGTVDQPLGRDPKNRLRFAVVPDGKRAVTHYQVLERFGNWTLIALELETGRTHQIRVHMAWLRHPLLGDPLYASAANPFGVQGQMLHAASLGFQHPGSKESLFFEAPPPEDFLAVLEKLRAGV